MQRGETRAADGTRIAWRLWPGEGPRLACLHSLALDGGMWEGVAAALAGRASLLAPDCRGHGASGRAAGPYTPALMADDLAAVLDALGWQAASVAGCSMGGCVAQAFAALHPARTEGLALIDTTAWYGPDAPAQWGARAATARREGLGALRGFQAERWFSADFAAAHPGVLERWLDVFVANDVECYAAACAMLGSADLRPLLARIAAPTRVLVGEHDHATPPAMARALAAAIPGATLTVLPGARHITPIERPAELAAWLEGLLRP
jgi:3-oxoadipate enol-lactonase